MRCPPAQSTTSTDAAGEMEQLAHWDCWGWLGDRTVSRPEPNSTPEHAMELLLKKVRLVHGEQDWSRRARPFATCSRRPSTCTTRGATYRPGPLISCASGLRRGARSPLEHRPAAAGRRTPRTLGAR